MKIRYTDAFDQKDCFLIFAFNGNTSLKIGEIRVCQGKDFYEFPSLHVKWIGVHVDYQRHKIGSHLYLLAARESCKRGLPLQSGSTRSEQAQKFWEKQVRKKRATYNAEMFAYQLTCPPPKSLDGLRRR